MVKHAPQVLVALFVVACAPPEREPIAPAATPAASAVQPAPAAATPAPSAAPLPQSCERGMTAAPDGGLDDFEDGDSRAILVGGRSGYWFTAADNHGSTIEPKGQLLPSPGGPGASKQAARVVGKTLPDLPAWGAVMGVGFLPDNRLYDASKYAGVSFWAKVGPSSTTQVRLKLSDVNTHPAGGVCRDEPGGCWNHFGKDLSLSTDWQEYRVAFAELAQEAGWGNPRPMALSAQQLVSLDFSLPRGHEFELWVDDVRFLVCL